MYDETEDDETAAMQDRMHRALGGAIAPDGSSIVTRWCVMVETFTEEGKSCIYLAAPDMAAWEIVGMAEMMGELARTQFATNVAVSLLEEEDLDDEDVEVDVDLEDDE